MDLYLKIDRPEGKKFLFVENGKIRRLRDGSRPSVILYPDRPTSVANADAEHLLTQDPHLVSKDKPDFSKKYPTSDAEWKAKVEELEADAKEYLKDIDALTKQTIALQNTIDKLQSQVKEQKEIALKATDELKKVQKSVGAVKSK
jgi:hypothetical protein